MHHHQHHYRRQTSNRHQINPNGSVSTSSDETIEPSSFGSSTAPPNNRIRTNPNYFGVEFRCKDGRLRSTYIQIDPSKKRNIFMLTSPIATSTSDRKNLLEPSPQDEHNAPSQKSSLGESLRSGFKRHRRRPTMEVLSWSKAQISHPLLDLKSKHLRKEALDCFKLVQAYMGDDDRSEPNVDIAAKNKPEIGLVCSGWNFVGLRNEIYMQLVKQTTNNMNLTSLQRGIELIAICLWFFPPSPTYRLLVESHIKHLMSSLSFSSTSSSIVVSVKACHDRLEKIALDGPRKGLKNPSPDEIDLAKRTIYHISMFGSSLEALMAIQASYLPDDGLPWILTLLSNEVLRLNGAQTEGIFRIPGDIDRVNMLKAKCDRWQLLTDRRMLVDILVFNNDPHVPASLLKLWYRQLADPLIPYDLYDDCIRLCRVMWVLMAP
ncbi:hypothetical protein ACOME3_009344 [Neoechinorhynchus agilis]